MLQIDQVRPSLGNMPKCYIKYWIQAEKYYIKHLIMQLLWFRVL